MVGRRCRWFSVVLVVGIGCWCLCTSGKSIANCNQLRLRFEIEDARESGGYFFMEWSEWRGRGEREGAEGVLFITCESPPKKNALDSNYIAKNKLIK